MWNGGWDDPSPASHTGLFRCASARWSEPTSHTKERRNSWFAPGCTPWPFLLAGPCWPCKRCSRRFGAYDHTPSAQERAAQWMVWVAARWHSDDLWHDRRLAVHSHDHRCGRSLYARLAPSQGRSCLQRRAEVLSYVHLAVDWRIQANMAQSFPLPL